MYYENCDAARAAGAAPVHRGDPGYGSHLDRDGDGAACESLDETGAPHLEAVLEALLAG